jgi:hypothetical protein
MKLLVKVLWWAPRLLTSIFPNYHLLAQGYCPLSLGFCLFRSVFHSQHKLTFLLQFKNPKEGSDHRSSKNANTVVNGG